MISVLPAKLPSLPHSPPHPFLPWSNPTCGPVGPISCSEVALSGSDQACWSRYLASLPTPPSSFSYRSLSFLYLSLGLLLLLLLHLLLLLYVRTELCSAEDWMKSCLHFVGFFFYIKTQTQDIWPPTPPSLSVFLLLLLWLLNMYCAMLSVKNLHGR